MSNFLETLTVEAYGATPEYTEEEYKQVEIDILKIEDNITTTLTGMNSESNTYSTIDYRIEEAITTESFSNLTTTIMNLATLNGYDQRSFLKNSEITVEGAKEILGSVIESFKQDSIRFMGFITKWISKATILLMKSEAKRKEMAVKLKDIVDNGNYAKVKIPETLLSKLTSKVGSKEKTNINPKALLTFHQDFGYYGDREISISVAKEYFNIDGMFKDNKYDKVVFKSIGRGRLFYIANITGEDVHDSGIVSLKDSVLKDFRSRETIGDMDISVMYVLKSLELSKREYQKEIDRIYKSTKVMLKMFDPKDPSSSSYFSNKNIRLTNKFLKANFENLKGVVNLAKDSITIADIIIKGNSTGEEENVDKATTPKNKQLPYDR